MYRLMKSDKFTLDHAISGCMSSYRQTEVNQFQQFRTAREACVVANKTGWSHYYILNESGNEYYDGSWID